MYAYAPVMTGEWKQHEVWDGTYSFKDLLDWHEMNRVKRINRARYEEYQQTMRANENG